MKKWSISTLILVSIFKCAQIISAQAIADERQKDIFFALNEARAGVEIKVNKNNSEAKNNYIRKDFYQAIYNNDWKSNQLQTEVYKSQINFFTNINFNRRQENPTIKKTSVMEFIENGALGQNKFTFQPIGNSRKEQNNIFYYKKEELPLSTNSNISNYRFYNKQSAQHFYIIKESDNSKIEDKPDITSPAIKKEKFHWKPALIQSLIFLGIQQSFRMTEEKTRKELGGPFFQDWKNSVKNLRGWSDGNKFLTNYVAHPLQGANTGRIFINNSDRAKKQVFGMSKQYWESRAKALLWSAVWSTQFELGPISEASLGNVGLHDNSGPSKMSWGDLVVTPILGTAFLIGEDAIDKYILQNWLERKNGYRVNIKIKILRSVLTPTTSFANLLRGKPPWKRDNRLPYQNQISGK